MNRALIWMSATVVCYSTVAIATREVSFEIDTPSILFIRSLVSIVLVTSLLALSHDGFAQIKTEKLKVHIVRNGMHFVGQFGWFFAIASIPLAHVFALEFTVPIWIALLAPIFLKEHMTKQRLLYIGIGFAGIIAIVRPFGIDLELGSIIMLIGAIGFAVGMLTTRHLAHTDSPLCILFYMAVLQLPLSAILLFTIGPIQTPSLVNFGLIVFITAGVMFAHYCMTRAFRLAEIISVIPVEYIRLPLIATVGALIYAEPVDAATIIGSIAILIANYLNVRYSAKNSPV